MEDNISTELEYVEALKQLIKDTVNGICQKNISTYPNICRFASRSNKDVNDIVDMILQKMVSNTIRMELDVAISMTDAELELGFGE